MARAVKQIVRKYYKYVDTPWTQPVLSSNGTMGGSSFACGQSSVLEDRYAWRAFNTSVGNWHSTSGSPQWISWYNPIVIKITQISLNLYQTISGTVQASNDNSTWTDITSFNSSGNTIIDISGNENYYKYYRLYCTYASYGWTAIDDINITATQITITEGTSSDYDFYEDVNTYKVPTTIVRHYYKYVYTDATSPVFASENQAVSGINNFKMTTTTSYWYITGNSTNTFTNGNTLTFDIGENNKNIKSIGYIGVVSPGNYPGTVLKNIQCSEDNQNWITISSRFGGRGDYKTNPLQITTPNNYRYIRFTTACDDGDYSRGGAYGLQIKYDARGYQESTSSDYDFYIDKNTYYGVNQ